jgi:PPM family protein phosphatase
LARQPYQLYVQHNEHLELAISPSFTAISDVGIRHEANDDAVYIRLFERNGVKYHVMAVCDGLSSTVGAGEASDVAAKTCVNILYEMINAGTPNPTACMEHAIHEAHEAVCELDIEPIKGKDPPGTTIVAAVAWRGHAVIGWVGDSRAYLFSDNGNKLLTHDHSWVNEVVDGGLMTFKQASDSPNAHVITRCLGPIEDLSTTVPPEVSVIQTDLPNSCRLMLCTDGLWNYWPEADELARVMTQTQAPVNATAHARSLVKNAKALGGHDNITLAICDLH